MHDKLKYVLQVGALPCSGYSRNPHSTAWLCTLIRADSLSYCRYIITCTDYYSKWAEAAALSSKAAVEVAGFLYSLFCRHGVPVLIMSDQGREFVNKLNDELFMLTGVRHYISTAYHPQTNGLDERFNQTLQRTLLKMVQENDGTSTWTQSCLLIAQASKHLPSTHRSSSCMAGIQGFL